MSKASRAVSIAVLGIVSFLATGLAPAAQGPVDNPYRPVRGLADGGGPSVPGGEWARLPGGREMGPPASVHVDVDGESIWAFIRCDETSPVPPHAAAASASTACIPTGNSSRTTRSTSSIPKATS